MNEAEVGGKKPCLVAVEEGKRYFWCTCGRSKRQPFCDSSHRGTDFLPLVWTAEKAEEVLFCACKRTHSQPICDGSHNSLSDTYESASATDGAGAVEVDYESAANGMLKAKLDNGCFVVRPAPAAAREHGTLTLWPAITADDGADKLSQHLGQVQRGATPVIDCGNSDVALFVLSGVGKVRIAGESFDIGPETGVAVKPGEGFEIMNEADETLEFNMTICPIPDDMRIGESPADHFDDGLPGRVAVVDEEAREAMGDRFYQVLLDEESHATPITQFIGEVPKSRAAHHHHLYEETITILSGEGYMWTDDTKTAVKPGDTIYLPRKQAHSLECTSDSGMRLIGLFYPSMSPAINY